MSYNEALTYLNTLPAFHHIGAAAYKPGLERMQALMHGMGEPHLAWHSVHVAGTNGKGSTSSLIAAALTADGRKTGLYTSPHLVDWRERIRIDGEMIREEYVARWVERYQPLLEHLRPSYFEAITALAFCYFADEHVDWAVVECGLGGRLDSTNIIHSDLAVITNIGLDHTAILGDTRALIAAEKAGIMKPFPDRKEANTPPRCIVGECDDEIRSVFRDRAKLSGYEIVHADECNYLQKERERYVPTCGLHGAYQQKNMQTAFVALRALHIPHTSVAEGFAKVCRLSGLRGRWEILNQHPLTICDTGHNSHGIRTYVDQLKDLMKDGRYQYLRIVFGMVSDKDVDQVMRLLPKDAFYYWTKADTERAIPADEMLRRGLSHGLIGVACANVDEARRVVLTEASDDDLIFIGGSNFIVGEYLSTQTTQTT